MPKAITIYNADTLVEAGPSPKPYPCILVHIGIGVSYLKVFEDGSSERIGGSSLGSGMLTGLLSMLSSARTYDEMLANAEKGDHTKVDRLVGDIYGADYKGIGFRHTDIASTFGKAFPVGSAEMAPGRGGFDGTEQKTRDRREVPHDGSQPLDDGEIQSQEQDPKANFSEADLSRSLLFAMSNNIGQLAYLHAQAYGMEDIYFTGSYISGHRFIIRTLDAAITYWTRGKKKALFLRPDRYLGALGASHLKGHSMQKEPSTST